MPDAQSPYPPRAHARYVIVGGGAASARAAVAIREHDPDGAAILVTAEHRYPYDRPPLTKKFLLDDAMTAEDPESKDPSWYPEHRVEVRRGARAVRLDRPSKTLVFADGAELTYERLLLAAGATPELPELPGTELPDVFLLRTVDDAERVRAKLQAGAERAVFLGAGYIGLEAAASCAARGVRAALVDPGKHPWERFAGPEAGGCVRSRLEAVGAEFHYGDAAETIFRTEAGLAVRTRQGRTLDADFVVIGVGVRLNSGLAAEAGLELDAEGAIPVDELFRTADPAIWAAGDVAAFPDPVTGRRAHVEHYLNATWTGAAAGAAMAGAGKPYDKVAYLFSDLLDLHMILRGSPGGAVLRRFGAYADGEFAELSAAPDGALLRALLVSKTESNLDPIGDRLAAMIAERAKAADVDPALFAALGGEHPR